MLLRWVIISFYALSVALFAGYVYLVGLFNQMVVDGTPKLKYEYIIGKWITMIKTSQQLYKHNFQLVPERLDLLWRLVCTVTTC